MNRDRLLQSTGVRTVLDVGAHVGQFASKIRSGGFSGMIVSFEPNPAPYLKLRERSRKDPNWVTINVAAGATGGQASLYVSGNEQSSSLLPISERHVVAAARSGTVRETVVVVDSLDEILSRDPTSQPPYMLKLDVQGFEDQVLAGSRLTLCHTVLVEVELSLQELYSGGADVVDMVVLLRQAGFRLCDVSRVFADPKSGALLQFDGLFISGMAERQLS